MHKEYSEITVTQWFYIGYCFLGYIYVVLYITIHIHACLESRHTIVCRAAKYNKFGHMTDMCVFYRNQEIVIFMHP